MLLLKKKKYAAVTLEKKPNGEIFCNTELKGLPIYLISSQKMDFCLRPSAKDLGITRVVVVLVLFHLSHLLFKRNLNEKKIHPSGKQPGVLEHASQALQQLSLSDKDLLLLENDLFNLRLSKTRPQSLDQSCSSFFLACYLCKPWFDFKSINLGRLCSKVRLGALPKFFL